MASVSCLTAPDNRSNKRESADSSLPPTSYIRQRISSGSSTTAAHIRQRFFSDGSESLASHTTTNKAGVCGKVAQPAETLDIFNPLNGNVTLALFTCELFHATL